MAKYSYHTRTAEEQGRRRGDRRLRLTASKTQGSDWKRDRRGGGGDDAGGGLCQPFQRLTVPFKLRYMRHSSKSLCTTRKDLRTAQQARCVCVFVCVCVHVCVYVRERERMHVFMCDFIMTHYNYKTAQATLHTV